MQKGLVSILCISMNHAQYIEQACKSIVSQSYANIEILYVDNNSADQTYEIANTIFSGSGFSYKGYKRTENYGISANLNFLLKEAIGEFIAVLSGDDWWENNNIEVKVNYLYRHPKAGLVYGNGYKFFQLENRQHLFYDHPQKSGSIFKDLLVGNLFFAVSVVSRHDSLKEIGFFDESLPMEDWDMYLRMAKNFDIGYIDEPTTYSRITGRNLSSNIEFMNKGYAYYFEKYKEYPEMKIAKKNIHLSQAFQLAYYSPSIKSLRYILKNFQFNISYIKQIIRCMAGIAGIKQKVQS